MSATTPAQAIYSAEARLLALGRARGEHRFAVPYLIEEGVHFCDQVDLGGGLLARPRYDQLLATLVVAAPDVTEPEG